MRHTCGADVDGVFLACGGRIVPGIFGIAGRLVLENDCVKGSCEGGNVGSAGVVKNGVGSVMVEAFFDEL